MQNEERDFQSRLIANSENEAGQSPPRFFGGLGLRPVHYPEYFQSPPEIISWLEIISENYMDSEGRPLRTLEKLQQLYPIALHGVSLSIAAPEDLDQDYLGRLKKLVDRVQPIIVSDHLCWTGYSAHNVHDLLPIVHDKDSLNFIAGKVQRVQETLGREIALENVSSYIESRDSTMSEAEFLCALHRKTGCRVLLDLNNIYVSETNFQRDPRHFIDAIPGEAVAQVHLAGFSDMGKFLFDTHSRSVFPEVWALYQYALSKIAGKPLLIEWDAEIPDLGTVARELEKARAIFHEVLSAREPRL
jgi:uncharacterized protein (UPF0276 family)